MHNQQTDIERRKRRVIEREATQMKMLISNGRPHSGTTLRTAGYCVLLSAAMILATPASASDKVGKDLQAVIALQGKPCGEVQASEKQGDNDYIAQCSNGKRYRVSMNASGRVDVVEQ